MPKPEKAGVNLYSRFSEKPCKIPEICLVDTNVFLGAGPGIADWDEGQLECAERCLKTIELIKSSVIKNVVVDGAYYQASEIFKEYCNQLKPFEGQSLAERVLCLLALQGRFIYREITPITGSEFDYAEFPDDPNLSDFDGSDRKFIAVANAGDPLPILQSMDGKWWKWSKALHEIGIEVLFNHPEYARKNCKAKNSCTEEKCEECNL